VPFSTPPPVPTRRELIDPPLIQRRQRGYELGLAGMADLAGRRPPLIIAVGGGKGGVGKSLVSANLAVKLAATGRKVLAIDLDVGGANLHTYFGLSAPAVNLADAIVLRRKTLTEAIVPTGIDNVRIIAGGREEMWGGSGTIDRGMMKTFFDSVFALRAAGEADFVIFDLGAGTHQHTIDFFLAAHLGMLTVLPEPTSVENAYLFLKTTLVRLVANVGERLGSGETADEVRSYLTSEEGRAGGYADKLRHLATTYPGFISHVAAALSGRTVGIAVNQIRCQKDIDVGKSMELIGERYFGFTTRYCGYLNYDEAAWKSLRNRRLLVMDFPHSVLARRVAELARSAITNLGFT